MMYAMRTSTLRPGTVEEFEARFAQRSPLPGEVFSIGGFLAH
jgi:heme-degrading monooxygenase HmoA